MSYFKNLVSPYVPWRLLSVLFLIDLMIISTYLAISAPLVNSVGLTLGTYITALISIFCPLLSGVLCMKGSLRSVRRSGSSEGVRGGWCFCPLLLGAGGLIYAAGQMIWLGRILVLGRIPQYPGPSHILELFTYLCFILAILLLPVHSISLVVRLRILLDSLIIMAAVTTLCYYFVLAPLLVRGDGTLEAKAVGGFYPVLGLLAMFCVLMVALRSGEHMLRPVLIILGLATALQFFVDIFHLYELLYKNYNEFSVANVGLIVYGTLLVGAAQTLNNLQRKRETVEPVMVKPGDVVSTDTPWKVVLPSMLVLVFGLLVFLIWLNGAQTFPSQMSIVYIGGFIVLILMVLRQFLSMYQIDVLQRRLQKKNRSLDALNMQLEKQATTDPLTDLLNHRALAEKLDEILGRAQAPTALCSVIFMDIDHFKAMNDCYGHLVGDMVLGYVAQLVRAAMRSGDSVGRWGGEEFVAILPEAGSEEACKVAEQIRVAVNQGMPGCAGRLDLSCSLGVATYPLDASEREGLLRQADRAMYEAKRLGRDQVCAARELVGREFTREVEGGEVAGMFEITEALLTLTEARDSSLSRRAHRVAALALKLAQELGLSREEARIVALSGLLHNLGDIVMADEFLLKRGQLNAGDLESRARYPVVGAEILAPMPALRSIATIVHSQCERVDGSGYPDGLKGEEIPLGARIVAVASAYDAALDARSLRPARAVAVALKEVRRDAGARFDPRVIEALQRVLAISPRQSRIDIA